MDVLFSVPDNIQVQFLPQRPHGPPQLMHNMDAMIELDAAKKQEKYKLQIPSSSDQIFKRPFSFVSGLDLKKVFNV